VRLPVCADSLVLLVSRQFARLSLRSCLALDFEFVARGLEIETGAIAGESIGRAN